MNGTGFKPTQIEMSERVQLTADMLTRGFRKFQIKRQLQKKFGVCARTAENYLSRARARLLQDSGVSRGEQIARVLDGYNSTLRKLSDPAFKLNLDAERVKLQTYDRIAKLLGLNQPEEVRPSGAVSVLDVMSDPEVAREVEKARQHGEQSHPKTDTSLGVSGNGSDSVRNSVPRWLAEGNSGNGSC